MEGFTLEYMPSNAALVRAIPELQKRLRLSGPLVSLAMFLVAGVLTFVVIGLDRWLNGPTGFSPLTALGVIAALVIAFLVTRPLAQVQMARRMDQLSPPTLTRLKAFDSGLEITSDLAVMRFDWRNVHGAAVAADSVLVLFMGYAGTLIPAAAFSSLEEREAFVAYVNARSDRAAS